MNESSILGGNFFLSLSKGQRFSNNLIKTNMISNMKPVGTPPDASNRMMADLSAKTNSEQQENMANFIVKQVQDAFSVFDNWLAETALKGLKKSGRIFVKGHTKALTILPELLLELAQVNQKKGGFTDYLNVAKKIGLKVVLNEVIGYTIGALLRNAFLMPFLPAFLSNPLGLAVVTVFLTGLVTRMLKGLLKKLSSEQMKADMADKYNSFQMFGRSLAEFPWGWKLFNYQFPKKPAATGIPRVPYDNFPALLHEGESVLTKRETNNLHNGMGSVHIAKLSDTIIIREEADIDKIASALTMRIRHAALNMA